MTDRDTQFWMDKAAKLEERIRASNVELSVMSAALGDIARRLAPENRTFDELVRDMDMACDLARGSSLASGGPEVLNPHKTMAIDEYAAMPIVGWHMVCRDVDGFGGVGIRYLGEDAAALTSAECAAKP